MKNTLQPWETGAEGREHDPTMWLITGRERMRSFEKLKYARTKVEAMDRQIQLLQSIGMEGQAVDLVKNNRDQLVDEYDNGIDELLTIRQRNHDLFLVIVSHDLKGLTWAESYNGIMRHLRKDNDLHDLIEVIRYIEDRAENEKEN